MDTLTIVLLIVAVVCLGCATWLFVEKKRLSDKLTKTEQDLTEAKEKIEDILQTRKAALWLLYLSELSFQASVSALHREQERSISLRNSNQGTINKYSALCEKIQSRAKRRLIGRGVGAALTLVPGLGLLEVAKDLIEISTETEEAREEIESVKEAFTEFSGDIKTEFSDISTDDEVPIVLTPDKQHVFKESFEHNIGSDLETLDASSLNSCVKDTILNMADSDSVQSMKDKERDDAIEEILRKVEDVVKDSYRDHQACKERQE